MTRRIFTALTIAGSDSGGGAGIQADLKTFAAHGVYGTSAITAITAQNTVAVTAVQAIPADMVIAQIEAIAGDLHIHAVKTGMLASAAIVEAVAATIAELQLPHVVVDPVMVAKSGDRLLDDDALLAMKKELLRRAHVVTPNIPEAEALSGRSIRSLDDAREAARAIRALGPSAVVIKGGHAEGEELIDLLYDGRQFHEFRTTRVNSANTHGTGCTFASAIAARLARGEPLVTAVETAQAYVAGGIRHAIAIGHGHGPLDHFWKVEALILEG
jgi:hydroxymethylpyrimidine/phosphomethylpyrimidine kinase